MSSNNENILENKSIIDVSNNNEGLNNNLIIKPLINDIEKLPTIENFDVSKFDFRPLNLVEKVQLYESYIYLYSENIIYIVRVLDEFIDTSGYQHGTVEFIDNQKRYNKVFLPRINQRNLYYLPSN